MLGIYILCCRMSDGRLLGSSLRPNRSQTSDADWPYGSGNLYDHIRALEVVLASFP